MHLFLFEGTRLAFEGDVSELLCRVAGSGTMERSEGARGPPSLRSEANLPPSLRSEANLTMERSEGARGRELLHTLDDWMSQLVADMDEDLDWGEADGSASSEWDGSRPFSEATLLCRNACFSWWEEARMQFLGSEASEGCLLTAFATPRKPYMWLALSVDLGEGGPKEMRRVAAFSSREVMLSTAPYRELGYGRPPLSGTPRIEYYDRLVQGTPTAEDMAHLSPYRLEAMGCAGVTAVQCDGHCP
jgi:hypothetical protein